MSLFGVDAIDWLRRLAEPPIKRGQDEGHPKRTW